jgi:hypothetical protein
MGLRGGSGLVASLVSLLLPERFCGPYLGLRVGCNQSNGVCFLSVNTPNHVLRNEAQDGAAVGASVDRFAETKAASKEQAEEVFSAMLGGDTTGKIVFTR